MKWMRVMKTELQPLLWAFPEVSVPFVPADPLAALLSLKSGHPVLINEGEKIKMWRKSVFSFVSFLICSPVCWCCVCLQNHHRHKTIEKRFYFCHMNARILLSAFDLFQYHSLDTYCFVSWALQTHPEYILNTLWKIQILDLTSANFI